GGSSGVVAQEVACLVEQHGAHGRGVPAAWADEQVGVHVEPPGAVHGERAQAGGCDGGDGEQGVHEVRRVLGGHQPSEAERLALVGGQGAGGGGHAAACPVSPAATSTGWKRVRTAAGTFAEAGRHAASGRAAAAATSGAPASAAASSGPHALRQASAVPALAAQPTTADSTAHTRS